jgi:hypothetical protein
MRLAARRGSRWCERMLAGCGERTPGSGARGARAAEPHAARSGPLQRSSWPGVGEFFTGYCQLLPEEPLIIGLQGVPYALTGKGEQALECMNRACASPKSFGHAHHTNYQIACIRALTSRPATAALEWLERSVGTGFGCRPFFLKDPCLQNLGGLPEFELLGSALQAKYPDHLGLL